MVLRGEDHDRFDREKGDYRDHHGFQPDRIVMRPSANVVSLIAGARCWLIVGILGLTLSSTAVAHTVYGADREAGDSAHHDSRHDFDFEVGTWKAQLRKLVHPLTRSGEWDHFDGTVKTRSLPMLQGWNESEMVVDSPTSHTHINILAVRLYNPTSQQWSIYGSSIKTGTFDPPVVGKFSHKRGEFYAQDTFAGQSILVRFVWLNINPQATHFEQAFSVDGGKSWETNWIYDGTRVTK